MFVEPKACGRPEQPPNSTMLAPNFNVGSVVEYTCDEGHLLVGPTMRTCLETGFYNEFPPVCKRKYIKYTLVRAKMCYLLIVSRHPVWLPRRYTKRRIFSGKRLGRLPK